MRTVKFLGAFILWGVFAGFSAFGQHGIVRGFVYDKENGEPIIGANVYLNGTTMGAASDVNGFFSISRIPPGRLSARK
jgi:hypothetical protein